MRTAKLLGVIAGETDARTQPNPFVDEEETKTQNLKPKIG